MRIYTYAYVRDFLAQIPVQQWTNESRENAHAQKMHDTCTHFDDDDNGGMKLKLQLPITEDWRDELIGHVRSGRGITSNTMRRNADDSHVQTKRRRNRSLKSDIASTRCGPKSKRCFLP